MTETHEQRVERLVGVIRAWLEEPGADEFDWHDLIRAIIASDREAGLVTVPQSLLDDARDAIETGVRLIERNQEAFEQIKGAMDTIHMLRARPWWKRLFSPALAAHEQEERQDAP